MTAALNLAAALAAKTLAETANPSWWEAAVAGVCSHGGHAWDGDTCSDAPEEVA